MTETSQKPAGSATDVTLTSLRTIDRLNPLLNAVITPMKEEALGQAERADALAAQGEWTGLLHGIPLTLKDIIDTAGVRTTSGSSFFAHHVPDSDAEVVRRLRAAGAILVGKANLHELAFGATNQSPHFGRCRNPWDPSRIPGGSSGGSAVAVATGMCVASIGSDTGGSVRMPAALTGVSALRPTVGRVSNRGTLPVSAPFDTLGPLARRVTDVARVFAVIAGHDPADPMAVDRPVDNFLTTLHDGIQGVRIGVPRNYYFDDLERDVKDRVTTAANVLAKLGAELVDITIPEAETAQEKTAFVILVADAATFHRSRLDEAPEKFGGDVYARLMLGRKVTGVDYADALRWLERWRLTLRGVFHDVDIVLSPTTPITAPSIDQSEDMIEITRRLSCFTYGWSFAGVPALAVPCGFASNGLPVGMQLAAAWWREPTLLRAGAAYQSATRWHLASPPMLDNTAKGQD